MDKELGPEQGAVQVSYLLTDETTLALLGTYDPLVLLDSAGVKLASP